MLQGQISKSTSGSWGTQSYCVKYEVLKGAEFLTRFGIFLEVSKIHLKEQYVLKQWGHWHYHNVTNTCHSTDGSTVVNIINLSIQSPLLSRYSVLQKHWLFGVHTQQPLATGFAALCVFIGCSSCLSLLVVTAILVQYSFFVSWGFKGHIVTHKNMNFSG